MFVNLRPKVIDEGLMLLPTQHQLETSTLNLSRALIERPSITPNEMGCLSIIENRLRKIGMNNQRYDSREVSNLYSSFDNNKPILALVGHVDVVPPGDLSRWHSDPFEAVQKNGFLYGRGAVDMKSAVAAMVVALEQFHQLKIKRNIDIALVLTSDEEGDAIEGVQHLVEQLSLRGKRVNWALVGEPSSENTIGDSIKIGRRGSLTGKVHLKGKQGHVGYPAQIVNPIKYASKILHRLQSKQWDLPSRFFPASSFQVVKFECDSGAENISPASLDFVFNMRYSPKQTIAKLQSYIEKKLEKTGLDYDIDWKVDAEPFITRRSLIRNVAIKVIQDELNLKPKLSTSGGTSDGRFFAKTGTQVVEVGLCNKGIHQANERVLISDLGKLASLYLKMLIQMNAANV